MSVPGQTMLDTIKQIYGPALARDLVHMPEFQDEQLGYAAEAWLSTADWTSKKTTFICFINHRLVDSPSLKRALETMYALMLPKGRHPWMYLAMEIEPARIDVNVHPTKQEVHFVDEEEIFEAVTSRAQALLAQHSSCRVYSIRQAPLGEATSENEVQVLRTSAPDRYDPRRLVRVDHRKQSLDAMMSSRTASLPKSGSDRIRESACELTSISELRAELASDVDAHWTQVLQEHMFVGVVDLVKALSVFQHGTRLYLVQHAALVEEFSYQLALRQFGAYTSVRLDPPPRLAELVEIGFDMEDDEGKSSLTLSRDDVVDRITRAIMARAAMLHDYFGIQIDTDTGTIDTFPLLLPQHGALGLSLERLPSFFFRLGPQVDWNDEKSCLDSLCRELAYAHVPIGSGTRAPLSSSAADDEAWRLQHVWFAAMHGSRAGMVVSPSLALDAVTQIADLPELCTCLSSYNRPRI